MNERRHSGHSLARPVVLLLGWILVVHFAVAVALWCTFISKVGWRIDWIQPTKGLAFFLLSSLGLFGTYRRWKWSAVSTITLAIMAVITCIGDFSNARWDYAVFGADTGHYGGEYYLNWWWY